MCLGPLVSIDVSFVPVTLSALMPSCSAALRSRSILVGIAVLCSTQI